MNAELLFNRDWKFHLDNPDRNWRVDCEEVVAPHLLSTDDSDWKTVSIPHDWSIDLGYDLEKGCGNTGFFLGGMGWYRKHFTTTKEMVDGITTVWFDGVYNNADYYINGKHVGFHPFAYAPICYDLSQYLNPVGEDNLLAVRVDHTRYADSRWYTGSGIYRKVRLIVQNKVNIPIWGTYITTPSVSDEKALVNLDIQLSNSNALDKFVAVKTDIVCPCGEVCATATTKLNLFGGKKDKISQSFTVANPKLWDIDSPKMYKAVTTVECDGVVVDENTTDFGIRYIEFNKDTGFFLNGKNRLIKGVCLHHDAGLVGSAVPDDVWARRFKNLQKAGVNAIRTSHNPVSKEFLDLCDKMGILVQEEFYDEWDNPKGKKTNGTELSVEYITQGHAEHFQEWAKDDLQNTMLRDRNHPSIVQWSIGNEIEWTYPKYNLATGYFGADAGGGYFFNLPPYSVEKIRAEVAKLPKDRYEVGQTARKLSNWTKEMDTTRPVIANCILPSASYESGYTDALDMVGFSYRRVVYDYAHKNYGEKPIMGTENVAQWHEWKAVLDRDFVCGIFLWTGIDYMGEVIPGKRKFGKGTESGILDFAGFEKTSFYMMKSLWNDEPMVHIATQTLDDSVYDLVDGKLVDKEGKRWDRRLWVFQYMNKHWNYTFGQKTVVEVYSNCDKVELFCNGKSLGKQTLAENVDHIYKWFLPFDRGELVAVGEKDGVTVSEKVMSAKAPAKIKLVADKTTLNACSDDCSHIEAQLYDEDDNLVTHVECGITFNVEGDVKVLGVDSGWVNSFQPYRANSVVTHEGRCLLIVQANDVKGDVKITATSDSLKEIAPVELKLQ